MLRGSVQSSRAHGASDIGSSGPQPSTATPRPPAAGSSAVHVWVVQSTLSGVIAHETTHIMIANHLGEVRSAMLPTWQQEGYADHVARESSLTDAEAAGLRKTDPGASALLYYDARRRVAAALSAKGGSVDAFFAGG